MNKSVNSHFNENIDTNSVKDEEKKRTFMLSIKNDEVAEDLEIFINELKAKNEQYNQTHMISGVQKTRKTVKESFTYLLVNCFIKLQLMGVEEARERGDLEKIEGLTLESERD